MDQASIEGQLYSLGAALRKDGYQFVTPTHSTLLRVNSRPGNERARSPVDLFGWGRAAATPTAAEPWLTRLREAGLAEPAPHGEGWRSRVRAASLDDDLLLHTGGTGAEAGFFGPDSYRFVRAIRSELAAGAPKPCRRVLDVGCGAGAAAIALARLFPQAEVVAADISEAALQYTAVNARLAGLHNITTCRSDLFDEVGDGFDLIVANPPTAAGDRRAGRHGGDGDGLGLARRLLSAALWKLAPGGTLMLYAAVPIVDGRDSFWNFAATLLDAARVEWRYTELDPDIGAGLPGGDADRIAAVWLVVRNRPM